MASRAIYHVLEENMCCLHALARQFSNVLANATTSGFYTKFRVSSINFQ